jgi:hypothetical protein
LQLLHLQNLKKRPVQPFPDAWEGELNSRVLFYQKLSVKDKEVFKKRLMHFLADLSIEGVKQKLQVTTECYLLQVP